MAHTIHLTLAVALLSAPAVGHELDGFLEQYGRMTTVGVHAEGLVTLEGQDPAQVTYDYLEADGRFRHSFEAPDPMLAVLYVFDGERLWRQIGEMETVVVGSVDGTPKIPTAFVNPLLLPVEFLRADPEAGCTFCQPPVAEVPAIWERVRSALGRDLSIEGTLNHDTEARSPSSWLVETMTFEDLTVPAAIERREPDRETTVTRFGSYVRVEDLALPRSIEVLEGDETVLDLKLTYTVNALVAPDAFVMEADEHLYDDDRGRFEE